VETAPVPAAATASNSETLTGSIEIIPDLYPSIRMPAQSKTKPSGPAALAIGRLISKAEPIYPPDALRQRISGTVKLHVVVGVDGRVESATVTEGLMQLSNNALQAVKQWRYEPTLLGTAPVEAEEDITMIFRIAASSRSGT
jgi:TonB family protein